MTDFRQENALFYFAMWVTSVVQRSAIIELWITDTSKKVITLGKLRLSIFEP